MWVIDNQQYLGELGSWNRAAQFGDGLFETLCIVKGVCPALFHHSKRLREGLQRLCIPNPESDITGMLKGFIESMVRHSSNKDGVLKVIVSRGDSARGYGFEDTIKPRVTVFYTAAILQPETIYDGVCLQYVEAQCSIQPQLAGLKHLNRLENVLAKKEIKSDCFEGIMTNYLGNIIECSMSNIFFERAGKLYTPDLSLSGVAGVMRHLVIQYCKKNSISIAIADIKLIDVEGYDGAFICNSVMGVIPVNKIAKEEFQVSPLIRKIVTMVRCGEIYD
ncbi:MAG: aminodeoxychorismate lyase [Bermanella sp.]